jgi:predicted nucleic acid-binding Zn ribbon protein
MSGFRRSSGPRRIGDAIAPVRDAVAPQTLLAAVQGAWSEAAGAAIAAEAEPVAERDGTVTVACHSATWAQELDLLAPELLRRLRESPGVEACEAELAGLRFSADAARHAD